MLVSHVALSKEAIFLLAISREHYAVLQNYDIILRFFSRLTLAKLGAPWYKDSRVRNNTCASVKFCYTLT